MTSPQKLQRTEPSSRGFRPVGARESRYRRRQLLRTPIAPILLAAMILPASILSWTPQVVTSRQPRMRKGGCKNFDGSCLSQRHCPLPMAENSSGSVRAGFLPTQSSKFVLNSSKRTTENQIDSNGSTNINGSANINGSVIDTRCLEMNDDKKPAGSILVVKNEGVDNGFEKLETPALSSSTPTPTPSEIHEIVIVLNTNAKGVTEDLINDAINVVEQEKLKISKTQNRNPRIRAVATSTYDEARNAAREIVNAAAPARTTLVIPVGGDGTLTAMINLLWEEQRAATSEQRGKETATPFPFVFGYVAMGTGNALGSVVGCTPVAAPPLGGRLRKRTRVLRFFRSCLRPRATKRDDFRRVISQLIETIRQTKDWERESSPRRSTIPEGETLPPLKVDTLELPLIRVRTFRGGLGESGIAPSGSGAGKITQESYAFFAGLGYDSLLLQDYKEMQDWTEDKSHNRDGGTSLLQLVTTGVVGYTVAMVTRSLPKLLKLDDATELLRDVKITTSDPSSAYWIDHRRGDLMRPAVSNVLKEEGAENGQESLVYRGSAGIIAAGTVPYYGGGLRLFPFARMTPEGMHLRIARQLHPLEGVSRIPWIFEGSYRDKSLGSFKCLDFVGQQFTIEIYESDIGCCGGDDSASGSRPTDEGFPFQHSGESVGPCTRVEFTASSNALMGDESKEDDSGGSEIPPPVRFVTLVPPRLVDERMGHL